MIHSSISTLEEDTGDADEEGDGRDHDVRELIHHWNRSSVDRDQPTDETRLTYDVDGLDKYGRPPPTHWSVQCPKSNPDEGPYGQNIVRLTGKINTDTTGEDVSDPGSSGASPPLLTMPGEDDQDEHGTETNFEAKPSNEDLTLDTLPIAGPRASQSTGVSKECGST